MTCDALGNNDEGIVKAMTSAASMIATNDVRRYAKIHNERLRDCMVN
jgi:hypothetical protein